MMSTKNLFSMLRKIPQHIQRGTFLYAVKKTCFPSKKGFSLQNSINKIIENKDSTSKDVFIASFLRKNFRKTFDTSKRLPCDYNAHLAEAIIARRTAKGYPENAYEVLLRDTEQLNPMTFTFQKWKNLEYLAMCNGLLRLGLSFRNKMIERAYMPSKIRSFEYLEELFKVFMDIGDHDRAAHILSIFAKKIPKNTFFMQKRLLYFYIFRGEREKALRIAQSYYGENDFLFASYIQDKKVALVGPAPSEENLAKEIDAYDVVLRLNCYSLDKLPLNKEFGTKFNVSCHNGENGQLVSDLYDQYHLPNIDFVIFKDDRPSLAKKMMMLQKARIMHMGQGFLYGLMLSGTANMIQNILYDLLLFQPKKIKLFKANFYLSRKTHYDGYQLAHNEGRPFFRKWEDFANHNILTQLNFTRKLCLSKQVNVDTTCESVLHLSNSEYVSKMEDTHIKNIPRPAKSTG